jgi:hypothetical protein
MTFSSLIWHQDDPTPEEPWGIGKMMIYHLSFLGDIQQVTWKIAETKANATSVCRKSRIQDRRMLFVCTHRHSVIPWETPTAHSFKFNQAKSWVLVS